MNNFNNVHHYNIYGTTQAETGGTSSNPSGPNNVTHHSSPTFVNIARQLETDPHITKATKQDLLTQLIESEWRVINLKREIQGARSAAAIAQAQNTVAIARAEVAEAATKQAENKIAELATMEKYLIKELGKHYGME